jgi:hypothetical protein
MGKINGAGIAFARQLLRKAGDAVEQNVLAALDERERLLLLSTTTLHWLPVDEASDVCEKIAHVAYRDDRDPMYRFGFDEALDHLRGPYRLLARVLTVPFLMEQSAKLWSRYHDTGVAHCERDGDHLAAFCVSGYPELPDNQRRNTAGYIAGTIALTGAQDVVVRDGGTPTCWRWSASWR